MMVITVAGDEIWAPMWDIRSLPLTFELKADSPTLVANSFNPDGATFRVTTADGLTTLATASGVNDVTTGPIAVTPGETYKMVYDTGFHVRPNWTGVEWARLGAGPQAAGPGSAIGFPSDAELGFDQRWGHLPSQFADTIWSLNVGAGERPEISVEHMTGNVAGAALFEWVSPSAVVTTADADGMPGSGGAHFQARAGSLANPPNPASEYWDEYTAPVAEAGWWGFKLHASDGDPNPYSWHYVLDRTDDGLDQHLYLRPGATVKPTPESGTTFSLLALSSLGLGYARRFFGKIRR
jgi:hypothetical protein